MTEQEEFEFRARLEAESASEKPKEAPGQLAALVGGVGKGIGSTALGLQGYVGKALNGVDNLLGNRKQTIGGLVKGTGPRGSVLSDAGDWLIKDAEQGRAKLAGELAPYKAAYPMTAGGGELAGEIVAALPVGGVLAKGVQGIASLPKLAAAAPRLGQLANSIKTGGMRTGSGVTSASSKAARAGELATRVAGGAVTGGTSAALVDPEHAGTGALVGGILPIALPGVGKAASYVGNAAKSLVQPFTSNGQNAIAANIIRKFGDGGPMNINAAELVPGSLPTLTEATGNAGIATLQRAARDIRPNAFVLREKGNAAARNAAFENIAGDASQLEAAIAARSQAAEPLYGKAFASDAMRNDIARTEQQIRSPFTGVGLSGAKDDLSTPGLRELARRPMFAQAVADAKKLAANKGIRLDDPLQSLEGLHFIKLALDDALNPAAKSAMGRNASAAIMSMREKLTEELANVAPLYGNARTVFADMSKPINAMEALQGLRVTDMRGNMTLAKVKNAKDGIDRLRKAPSISPAKSISKEQLAKLTAIHDDLLRQDALSAGRSAGSNTFQNIATDNIMSSLMPGKAGEIVGGKIGGVVGQVGRLAYSGPNEAIRGQLVDMLLDPELARAALARQQAIGGRSAVEKFLAKPGVREALAKSLPLVGADGK